MYKQYNFFSFFSKLSWKKALIFLPTPFLAQIETVIYPLIGLVIVIIADLFTALVSHFYNMSLTKKLKFNDYRYGIISGGLRQTIKKSYQYGMAIIVVFVIEVFGFGGNLNFEVPLVNLHASLTQFVTWAFAMIEIKSIDENLKGVSGKSFIQSIADIFKYFRDILSVVKGPEQEVEPFEEEEEQEH